MRLHDKSSQAVIAGVALAMNSDCRSPPIMVEIRPPDDRSSTRCSEHARTLIGQTSATTLVIMKNFVRLVRFAWPHRYRFALSIACAAMVALFYFTELGAVLPLLNILFKSENPQRWISTKIDTIDQKIILPGRPGRGSPEDPASPPTGEIARRLDLSQHYPGTQATSRKDLNEEARRAPEGRRSARPEGAFASSSSRRNRRRSTS